MSALPETIYATPTGIDNDQASKLLTNFNCCFLKSGDQGKLPEGTAWQNNPRRPAEYRGQGIGILCGPLRDDLSIHCLDADTKHPELSQRFKAWLQQYLEHKDGAQLQRIGQPPKFLVPFVCAEELRKADFTTKKFYPAGEKPTKENANQLEVLGKGNQFVAYQIHPDTGQPYQWGILDGMPFGEDLYSHRPEGLLQLCRADLVEVKAAFERICSELGLVLNNPQKTPPAPPAAPTTGNSDLKGQPMKPEQAQSYLDAIPNSGEGQDYDTWLNVGMALKQELGNSGLPMFLQWSRQSSKHDDQTAQYKWDSFKGGNTAGAFLGNLAKQCGWRSSADKTFDQFQNLTATSTASADDVFTPPERDYLQVPEAFRQTVIGKLASRVAHCLEFPEASASLALLAGASAAVATSYAVQYASGTPVPTGIYSVIEQPPSMRKSQLLDFSQVSYLKAMRDHNARIWKHNDSSGDDDPKAAPGFVVTTDATTAGLDMTIAGCSEGRFFIASAEQAAFQSLFPEKGDFASHNGLLLQGWAGEYASATRKGRNAFSGYVSGSVLVIAQPGSSARVFSASNGTGLAERFFYLSEPTPLGTRTLHGEFVSRNDLEPFKAACSACVKDYSERRLADIERSQDPEHLRQLTLTREGYQLMLETRRKVEPKLGRLARDGEMLQVGWLGKIETHTLKVAAVLHVVECLGNGCNPSSQIPLSTVQTALEYVEMLAEHLTHILHDSGESGEAAEIDAVMDLITSRSKPYKVRPLAQALRKRHPFRAMGKESYTRARQRVESMIQSKRLLLTHEGEIHPI
jgi:hypothetical protein